MRTDRQGVGETGREQTHTGPEMREEGTVHGQVGVSQVLGPSRDCCPSAPSLSLAHVEGGGRPCWGGCSPDGVALWFARNETCSHPVTTVESGAASQGHGVPAGSQCPVSSLTPSKGPDPIRRSRGFQQASAPWSCGPARARVGSGTSVGEGPGHVGSAEPAVMPISVTAPQLCRHSRSSHRPCASEWVQLGFDKTLFTQTSSGPALFCRLVCHPVVQLTLGLPKRNGGGIETQSPTSLAQGRVCFALSSTGPLWCLSIARGSLPARGFSAGERPRETGPGWMKNGDTVGP